MPETIPPYKEFAVGVGFRAGNIIRRNFNDHLKRRTVRHKSRYEIVTSSDMEAHKFIEYKVKRRFPDHNFISEEGKGIDNGSEYTWLVDPLDGTLNYTIGNPFFCTAITLLKNDEPLIGVLYAPMLREMFVVEKGRGVRLNERNIRVSQETRLKDSVLSFSYFKKDPRSHSRSLKLWQKFEERSRAMRHLGCVSLELAYVACGRMEASVLAPPLRMWDIAAGMLLVDVAGGKITDFHGKPWKDTGQGLVVSNGGVHRSILNVLKK